MVDHPEKPQKQLGEPPLVDLRGCIGWWNSLNTAIQAAIIGGVCVILAALIGLVAPIVDWSINRPTPTFTPTVTLTPAPTGTPTYTPIPPTPTKTLTPIPTPTPYATVKAFSVIKNSRDIVVWPDEMTDVTIGSNLVIRARVETNTALTNLLFTWRTCRTGERIIVWGNGVFEMHYEAPGAMGTDCIRLKVEKGGALLNDAVIYVNVHE